MALQIDHGARHRFLPAAGCALGQAAEEGKELLVEQVDVLFDQLAADVFGAGLQQALDHLHPLLLLLEHLRGNAILAQDGLDHGFIRQVCDGLEQIGLAFFGRQTIGDLFDQRSDQAFLFVERHIQLRGKEREQQFLLVVMIHDGRSQAALIAAVRTARHIRYTAEQSLLGLRILCHVKKLFDVRRDHLTAAGTGNLCLRHWVISDLRF